MSKQHPKNIDELIQIRIATGTPLKWIGNTKTPNNFSHSQFEQGEPMATPCHTQRELKRMGFVGIYKSII